MIQFTGKDEYFFFIPENAEGVEVKETVKSIEDFASENNGYVENNIIVFGENNMETLTFIVDGIKVHHAVLVRPFVKIIKE